MGPDCYKVDILHYLSPHLLWVEVTDPAFAKIDEFFFEQIGLYGVLPLEPMIDIAETNLMAQRCESWKPAATVLMKEALSEATDVYFCPTHIDRRTSIFDDNIHKYGEIILVQPNGEHKKLSKFLIKPGFALYDECLFHQQLSSGNLNTKLNNKQTKEVIKQLNLYYKKEEKRAESVKQHTSVFHATQNLESALTVKNLEIHNTKQQINDLLHRKFKDLDLCKDIEEESLGRASRRKQRQDSETSNSELESTLLKKKLEIVKGNRKQNNAVSNQNPLRIIQAIKRFSDANALKKDDVNLQVVENEEEIEENDDVEDSGNACVQTFEQKKNMKEIKIKEIEGDQEKGVLKFDYQVPADHVDQPVPRKNNRRVKKPHIDQNKEPEFNPRTEKRVAYGPPETDRSKLPIKIVPAIPESTYDAPNLTENNVQEEILIEDDIFAGVDSLVDLEITNKGTLKQLKSSVTKIPNKVETEREKVQESNSEPKAVKEVKCKEILSSLNKPASRSLLQRRLEIFQECKSSKYENSFTSVSDTSDKDTSGTDEAKPMKCEKTNEMNSDDDSSEVIEKIKLEYTPAAVKVAVKDNKPTDPQITGRQLPNNVNPFKNIDPSFSIFVDKLVTPVLMLHTKTNKRIEPSFELRNVHFNSHIQIVLKNMGVDRPKMMQTVSWFSILRGYSLFMIGPKNCGKTMGYVPAVCRHVSDAGTEIGSVGPICIIVCATAVSVSEVEHLSRMFLGRTRKVLACYAGMNELDLTTALLNGCDLMVCTPSILVRMLQATDFGVDLRRLTAFVLDDCERTLEVYLNEIKFFLIKVKEMLKNRAAKELKVQFILASRVWCDIMEPLAKKALDTVICIGAFQECVLYSKAHTTASFVRKENKLNSVLEFVKTINRSKKTVIVCRDDEEVETIEKALKKTRHVIFACNNTMTVQELYNFNLSLNEYHDPALAPILVCCDGNLMHLNITDAHYLIHYSLPHSFSSFCKRFSVLNDNYASIFKEDDRSVRIKILLEDSNVEQLPKILHFIKRCTNEVPEVLDDICKKVLSEKDEIKARNLVPLCDNLLTLGDCPDYWNCNERHAMLKEVDESKDWVPRNGVITFTILHYHNAVSYSGRLLTNTTQGQTSKYPQTHKMLSMKLAMYYSKESNRKLQGIPLIGDVCAVAIKQNYFLRCQVVTILSRYRKGNPNEVLIKLIDEEKFEKSRDIYLYHLPEDMKITKTYVVQIRLANIRPKDKDITFSDLAKDHLKNITDNDEDLYMRGHIALTIGNCILVDELETCRDLTSMNKTVVRHDFRQELMNTHAILNNEHIPKLEKLCKKSKVDIMQEIKEIEVPKPQKMLPQGRWAHLESDDFSSVLLASAKSPDTFFVRLDKFKHCSIILHKDIQKHVAENREILSDVEKGDIVLARLPDDGMYERARIDEVLDDGKLNCFFVDHGNWSELPIEDLLPITEKFITQLPFQAIECRLIGVKPGGDEWTDFSTNWFTNCFWFRDDLKVMYVKYFTKEKSEYTGGHKYGVTLIDTNTDQDLLINRFMIDANLAQEDENEVEYLNKTEVEYLNKTVVEDNSAFQSDNVSVDEGSDEWEKVSKNIPCVENTSNERVPLEDIFPKKPMRSVPLVDSDYDSDEINDKWNVNMTDDFMALLKPMAQNLKTNVQAIEPGSLSDTNFKQKNHNVPKTSISKEIATESESSFVVFSLSDDKIVTPKKNKGLDSDDLSSSDTTLSLVTPNKSLLAEVEVSRKPKLCWRQTRTNVSIKIQLIVEKYDLTIKERSLKFNSTVNDTKYGFEFDLYGVIDVKKSSHANKGQYILVNMTKILTNKTWLTLARDGGIRKWIVYDVDSLDTSSDEEVMEQNRAKFIKNFQDSDSDSDDEFLDDYNYKYNK